jgi:dipeptidyl aminopeptidase/acylaminoacyl peptidase
MNHPERRPYGSWPTSVTAHSIAAHTVLYDGVESDGETLYWVEARTANGQSALVCRRPDGTIDDLTAVGFDVGSRVHEYGGRAAWVGDGVVVVSCRQDDGLYRIDGDQGPVELFKAAGLRFADATFDFRRSRLICVQEDHTDAEREPASSLVAISLAGGATDVLVAGADFYGHPRVSPDGTTLSFLTWHHPHQEADATELWLAPIDDDGVIGARNVVAGGDDVSVLAPEWSPANELFFVSDQSGWWNLYRLRAGTTEPVWRAEAEFVTGTGGLGGASYCFLDRESIVGAVVEQGQTGLMLLELESGTTRRLPTGDSSVLQPRALGGGWIGYVGASMTCVPSVVRLNVETCEAETVARSSQVPVDRAYAPEVEPISFPTADGAQAHGFLYRPRNPRYTGLDAELPPLLVYAHGGPVAVARPAINLGITAIVNVEYWTSRGFAVLAVNYRGSTGYGRQYRMAIRGRYGEVDPSDCLDGATYLIDSGAVDRERVAIRGPSAGGYTTLRALVLSDAFCAGADYFGLADLEALMEQLRHHKYEAHIGDTLWAPYPEATELYRERSPVHDAARIRSPLIVFQGTADTIVPPQQSLTMIEALSNAGVPHAYRVFDGEGHGFRRAANIEAALLAELTFYGRVMGFTPAEVDPGLVIENGDRLRRAITPSESFPSTGGEALS